MINQHYLDLFIRQAIAEDLGDGDHTSLACIEASKKGGARLLVKQTGILAGMEVAPIVFKIIDPELFFVPILHDGARIERGQIAFTVEGTVRSILKSERLVLNILQRMSGIASRTNSYVEKLEGLKTTILDTRKTTPGMRFLEKEAVRIGGGLNHRMGLFDMIMIKDNHIDYAGGIEEAIHKTRSYLQEHGKKLRIEIEARSIADVEKILSLGGVHRIMLDNFNLADTRRAVELIGGTYETESSGMITLENIRDYAECGVDFISVGALTHQISSLDLSLKAFKK
jgi:nicotinate-nucleotide pyrophosphorylase (carboxylating)